MYELKGIAILNENIYDVKSYKDKHNEAFTQIREWASNVGDGFTLFEPVDNHRFACAYRFTCSTEDFCHGLSAELQSKLRREFPSLNVLVEQVGEVE